MNERPWNAVNIWFCRDMDDVSFANNLLDRYSYSEAKCLEFDSS